MAIPIGETPVLKGKAAERFLKKIEAKPSKRTALHNKREKARAMRVYNAIKNNSDVWL